MMPGFVVTLDVKGELRQLDTVQMIKLANDAEMIWGDGAWKIRVQITAADQNQAAAQARQFANTQAVLLQAFLSDISSFFRIFVDDSYPLVQNASTGEAVPQIQEKMRRYMAVFVTTPASTERALTRFNSVLPIQNQNDCQIVLHFFATAMKEEEDLYKFLNYITAIEAMISEPEKTTEKISRRLSALVSSQPGLQDMQATYEKFKAAYNARSDVLHGREIPNITLAEVDYVSGLTRIAVRNYFLLRLTLSRREIKAKLDKASDEDQIDEIRQLTTF